MKKKLSVYIAVFFSIFIIDFGLNSYLSFNLQDGPYLFYQNINNLLPLFTTLVGLGTPFSVLYLTSLSKSRNSIYLLEANLFTLIFSCCIFVIVLILYNTGSLELYVMIALILAFFNAIKQNSVNYFLSAKELNKSSFIRLNQKVIYIFIIILFLYLFINNNKITFSASLIMGELIGFIVLVGKYKIIKLKAFTKIKSIIKISKYSFLANIFAMISLSIPIIFLNYFGYTTNEIVSFSIAYTLLRYSGILLGPFMQLITPYFTPIKKSRKKVEKFYLKYLIIILLTGVFVSVFMYFSSPFLIGQLFNKEYKYAIHNFKILLFAIPFLFINSFTMSLISSVINVKLTARIVFFTMLFMGFGAGILSFNKNNTDFLCLFILCFYIIISIVSVSILIGRFKQVTVFIRKH
jgi:O-antigen/teichoic acid export membrane protein